MVPSMSQIELFENYWEYLKPYKCVQIISIKNSYWKLYLFTNDYD